ALPELSQPTLSSAPYQPVGLPTADRPQPSLGTPAPEETSRHLAPVSGSAYPRRVEGAQSPHPRLGELLPHGGGEQNVRQAGPLDVPSRGTLRQSPSSPKTQILA